MEGFIPGECSRKKGTFRNKTERPKFSVPFDWITSARIPLKRKQKICQYFLTSKTQSNRCFPCKKNTSNIFRNIFTEISVKIVSALWLPWGFHELLSRAFPGQVVLADLFLINLQVQGGIVNVKQMQSLECFGAN